MKQKIIFATGNEGKMKEIREILRDLDVEIHSIKEEGLQIEIEENGTSFQENALIKAKTVCDKTGLITLADDSGLEVDYLEKAPGIYSARFLGADTSYHIKNQYIIDQLAQAEGEQRSARFVCVIACVLPDGRTFTTEGVIEGRIGYEEKGTNGFGYDPIFFLSEYGCTTAELSSDQKNAISHRGRALEAMKKVLKDIL